MEKEENDIEQFLAKLEKTVMHLTTRNEMRERQKENNMNGYQPNEIDCHDSRFPFLRGKKIEIHSPNTQSDSAQTGDLWNAIAEISIVGSMLFRGYGR